jgi:hypothetical protein
MKTKPALIGTIAGSTRLMAVLLLWALPAVIQAQFICTTNNGTLTITGYTGPGGAVTIPGSINGLPVTSIGDFAFGGNRGQIAIPDNKPVTSITIPNSVTSIGKGAFNGCFRLTNAVIPNSVTNIGDGAFYNCQNLRAIMVDAGNSIYSTVDGVLIDKSRSTLIQFPEGKADSYTIPNSVTSIGNAAFEGCTGLTNIMIPDSITNIGNRAFRGCTKLTNVTIPDSVISISAEAFAFCIDMTNIVIGGSLTSIGEQAFEYCSSLTSVTIPKGVSNIADGAFGDCLGLRAIMVDARNSFYSSVDGVLFDKSQTTLIRFPGSKAGSYIIPKGVTSIGHFAFENCYSLTNVAIPDNVTSIGNWAFSDCYNLTNLMIGGSVTSIGNFAFSGCSSLNSVTIPASVTNIGDYAFRGRVVGKGWSVSNLMGIYFKGNAPSIGQYALYDDTNATIYYLPGTTGWGATFGSRPTAVWKQ